jgi:hypothetical protein
MTNLLSQRAQWILLAIMTLMIIATRYNHFFNQTLLADVTWAAFFIAGLVLSSRLAPVVLIVEVLAIDLGWRILSGTASENSCVSAAYPFLVVAYGSLWVLGRLTAKLADMSLKGLAMTYAGLTAGVLTSFAISNTAWYAFSGQYDAMPVLEFAEKVSPYFFSFLQGAAFWVTLSVAVWFILSKVVTRNSTQLN